MLNLTDGQKAVLLAFSDFGLMTDAALATYVHHMTEADMSSSGIRTRRAELLRKGLVQATGRRKMKSGRHATIFGLTSLGKLAARQVRREQKKVTA